jgi:hypothetical protein
MEPGYLTPAEVSRRLGGGISVKTLANWRSQGKGPPFRRVGGRVLYPIHEFEAWERASAHVTSEVRDEGAPWTVDDADEVSDEEVGMHPADRWLYRQRKMWKPVSISSEELLRTIREEDEP